MAPRPGATVKLASVYSVLTLLPGASRDYTRPEFARDLYLLDQSGVTVTKNGRVLSLPASALTRGSGVLTTVTRGRTGEGLRRHRLQRRRLGMIAVDDYVEFLDAEYLHGYVDQGGAAVKFVLPADGDEEAAARFSAALRARGEAAGFAVARVDAVTTKVHLIEQVFFAVSRQVAWDELAASMARTALDAAAYPVAEGDDLSVDAVAAAHGIDARELKRDVDRQLQQLVHRDYRMVQEFRIAMLRLCQAALRTGQVADAEHAAVLDWLNGDLRQISVLKSALIFRRIARHNARHLLFSLAHWLAANGRAGLVLELDIRRLGHARRPSPDERSGFYYTKAAVLDAYEVLRQLVDNTDELSHCCVVVVAAPEFVTDPQPRYRCLPGIEAAHLRRGPRPPPGQPVLVADPAGRGMTGADGLTRSAGGRRWRLPGHPRPMRTMDLRT